MDSHGPVVVEQAQARVASPPVAQAGAARYLRPDRTAHGGAISDHLPKLRAVQARDRRYRRSLAVADLVAVSAALLAATVPFGRSLSLACLLALPLVVALGKLAGLYDRDELLIRKRTLEEAPQLLHVATTTTLALWLVNAEPMTKGELVIVWAVLLAGALLFRRTARAHAAGTVPAERCLFIGEAVAYERLRSKLGGRATHTELVGRISVRAAAEDPDAVGELTALRELIGETGAHRVIIEPQVLPAEDMLDFVRAAKALGMHVSLLPRVLDVVGTAIVFDDLDGMTLLGVRRFGLTRSSLLVKRAFDVTLATLALVVVAPLMALIALAIKLDSGGPVFFWQVRVGRDGRRFRMCKFRTMVADAEERKEELRKLSPGDGGLFKIPGDPRATRVGRRLRETSLDELPQLLNVLRGEMSLVGPRPLVVDEDAQVTGWDRRRLYLTPGMTGNWQIAGSGRVPLQEMVKIDYLYVAGWSLWLDLKILLRTIPHVFARRGL
jgi:exopolysaccharide biosynthesis polyprenyl glycosylphosphotransferase